MSAPAGGAAAATATGAALTDSNDSRALPAARAQPVGLQRSIGASQPTAGQLGHGDIPPDEIQRLLDKYGVTAEPHNCGLYQQACTHSSYTVTSAAGTAGAASDAAPAAIAPAGASLSRADNEQLEYAGDALIGSVIALYLCEQYPDRDEGFLTRLRARLVNNQHLGQLAIKSGLDKLVLTGPSMGAEGKGRSNLRILGSALEAWVAAIYRDACTAPGGSRGVAFERVYTWVTTLIERHVNMKALADSDVNYKEQLQQHFQEKYKRPPEYREAREGPDQDCTFTITVLHPDDDSVIATATGQAKAKKQVVEQEAARLALVRLGVLQEAAEE